MEYFSRQLTDRSAHRQAPAQGRPGLVGTFLPPCLVFFSSDTEINKMLFISLVGVVEAGFMLFIIFYIYISIIFLK